MFRYKTLVLGEDLKMELQPILIKNAKIKVIKI